MDNYDRKPLRVWPGAALAILQLLLRFVLPIPLIYALFGSMACAALILLWWLLFSRARWFERLGALAVMAVGLLATKQLVDVSIATGAMGYLFWFLAVPPLGIALVLGAVVAYRMPDVARRVTMAAIILAACGVWALVRTGGFTAADMHNDLHWRWTPTPEQKLLAQTSKELGALPVVQAASPEPEKPVAAQPASEPEAKTPEKTLVAKANIEPVEPRVSSAAEKGADWPGFRGPHRDDVVTGVRIKTDWKASPPTVLWRKPVGPGWSSFAVRGGVIYTQEQRGPDEVVAAYKLATGEPVWAHGDPTRFYESNGGPGPRGTPTLSHGRVYTFGATGILNVLDARTGAVVWSHNAAADTGAKTPMWGFASSPLVYEDTVIVATAGRLAAYDLATGAKRWAGPAHGPSYSSPHLFTKDGVVQVLLLSDAGLTSVAPGDGTVLWEHAWQGYPIVQPAVTADADVLISVSDSSGLRRLVAAKGPSGWTATERWTSNGLKPYFNDFVVHKGHAYGFDGSIMSCIELEGGKRIWKGGRYGNGQLLLLADQDLLLVSSEEGDVALVKAAPDQFTELARFTALEGKTWNHPVLAGDTLLVRNGEQMVAFKLAVEGQ